MSINALFDEFKVKAATPKQQLAEYKACKYSYQNGGFTRYERII